LILRAGGVTLAVALAEVLRVVRPLPATRVPHASGCVEGVINLEHEIVPVLYLDRALGVPPAPGDSSAQRVVLVEVDGEPLGLRVDGVGAIRILPDDARVLAPEAFAGIDGGMLAGLCETAPGETVAILNVPEVRSRACARPLETD
jgi:purine-binding chemotaxis protein CheW